MELPNQMSKETFYCQTAFQKDYSDLYSLYSVSKPTPFPKKNVESLVLHVHC